MTTNNKVDKLYAYYAKLAPYEGIDPTLYRLCELLVAKLSDDEYDFMIFYMSGDLYPNIYKAVEESMREVMFGPTEKEERVVPVADKYGKN